MANGPSIFDTDSKTADYESRISELEEPECVDLDTPR